jgi:regulator of protease activity HflC (stomatin/prohibitin superfamily)
MKTKKIKISALLNYYYRLLKYLIKRFWYTNKIKVIVLLLIFSFFVVFFLEEIFITVNAGEVGVLWKRFSGTYTEKVYDEGMHIIVPWDKMYLYNTRIQAVDDTMAILTSQGMTVKIIFTYRYHPYKDNLPKLHQTLGPNYNLVYIKPEIEAAAMSIIGNYNPERLYQMSTQIIQSIIKQYVYKQILDHNIILEDFLIKKIELPKTIAEAIEQKMSKEQLLQEFDFLVGIEKKEKERKIIEAEGIKSFETISNIPILKWRGLEVTEKLSTSPNSKIILVGTGSNQLPILLNADGNK